MKTKIFLAAFIILISSASFSQEAPEPAAKILEKAYKQAAKEKKNVFVIFHASWCGWCRKMEASLNDPSCSEYFQRSYVLVHLTVLENGDLKKTENPGAEDMFKKYAGDKSGIPFFLIFDKKGKLLADSQIRKEGEGLDKPGKNMGCPAADDEVAVFVGILRKTSKITDAETAAVTDRFRKNNSH
ncbi:MAG: thioredoxin family protein [Bacteroidales bacterium]